MDNLNLFILIIIILLLLYIVFVNNNGYKKKIKSVKKPFNKINEDEMFNKIFYEKNEVLPYFIEMQYHNDYKNIATVFEQMAETGKQIFNRSSLPVTVKELDPNESVQLVEIFLEQLNEDLSKNIPTKSKQSGWEKQMKELGLPENIYDDNSENALIKLIKIDKFILSYTDAQIRYDIYLIIQKTNSYDQMVLKVSFVRDREDMNVDRNFFKDDKTVDLNVHLEDIFVIGFLTNHSYGSNGVATRQDFYTFENIEQDGIMNQEEIFKQLKKKYQQYQYESNGLAMQIDPKTGNNLAIERLKEKTPIGPFDSTNN